MIGILSFVVLYFYATTLYPGGSQANPNSMGYDWINNYWCNLLNQHATNGDINPARPFAIFGMVILCMTMVIFFYQVGEFLVENQVWKRLIQWNGGLSMIFGVLIFTSFHDVMTLISSLFGLVVVFGIIKEIYRSELTFFKISGTVCLLLLTVNNLIYYSSYFIEWLPLIQKISFLVVLSWVLGMNAVIRFRICS